VRAASRADDATIDREQEDFPVATVAGMAVERLAAHGTSMRRAA
jgi:hypothetical protein